MGYKSGSKIAKKQSNRMLGNKFGFQKGEIAWNKGIKLDLSNKERKRRSIAIQKINEVGFVNRGGRCKIFVVDGLRVQGRYEASFILELVQNGDKLPLRGKLIKTPHGFYTPDFEFDDHFIEIKSTYTIKTSIISGQMKKIRWVSNNVKLVKIIVMSTDRVDRILKNHNLYPRKS